MLLLKKINQKTLSLLITVIVAGIALIVLLSTDRLYPLEIVTDTQSRHFRVEVADTAAKQEKGLMFRTHLGDDKGMLFLFPENKPVSFWMRNTLIPLDMIFIDSNHKISFIHHKAQPHDESPVDSNGNIIAVLEIPGGQASSQNIAIGDIVKSPLLAGTKK